MITYPTRASMTDISQGDSERPGSPENSGAALRNGAERSPSSLCFSCLLLALKPFPSLLNACGHLETCAACHSLGGRSQDPNALPWAIDWDDVPASPVGNPKLQFGDYARRDRPGVPVRKIQGGIACGLRAIPAVYSPSPSQFLILEDGDGKHTAHQLFSICSFKVNPVSKPHRNLCCFYYIIITVPCSVHQILLLV